MVETSTLPLMEGDDTSVIVIGEENPGPNEDGTNVADGTKV